SEEPYPLGEDRDRVEVRDVPEKAQEVPGEERADAAADVVPGARLRRDHFLTPGRERGEQERARAEPEEGLQLFRTFARHGPSRRATSRDKKSQGHTVPLPKGRP